jgi:hypothetical protein
MTNNYVQKPTNCMYVTGRVTSDVSPNVQESGLLDAGVLCSL